MLRCPRCGETNPDIVDTTPDGRYLCTGCDTVWAPDDNPRIPTDPEPRTRRDLD